MYYLFLPSVGHCTTASAKPWPINPPATTPATTPPAPRATPLTTAAAPPTTAPLITSTIASN